jgi:flagellum-specific peptidoglycan hydrolase FlgJ
MTRLEKTLIAGFCIIALIITALDNAKLRKMELEQLNLIPIRNQTVACATAVRAGGNLPLRATTAKKKAVFYEGKDLAVAKAYVARFAAVAKEEEKRFGIPACFSMAQGLLESNAGRSRLATVANNHFGVKCFKRNCQSGCCINSADDIHKDFFKKYPSAWWSWRNHSTMLALPNGHYSRCFKHGKDYVKWARALRRLGYATEDNYAEQLITIIEQLELHKL